MTQRAKSVAVFTDEQEMFLHAEAPSSYRLLPVSQQEHRDFFRGALLAAAISSPFWIVAIICAIRHFNR